MKRIFPIIYLLLITGASQAQSWRYVRSELSVGIGASNFMGDLGGSRGIGVQGPKDFKIQPTRPTLALGYKYMLMPEISLKANAMWGYVSGDDKHTKNVIRSARNLSFRSVIGELSATVEFFPWGERIGPKYKIRGVNGNETFSVMPYFFVGIGATFFNPKAKLNDDWVALQPLGTEGQGLNGRPDKYSRVAMAFPIGMGLKYAFNKTLSISFDVSVRYTTTDYMDDVSTSYYHLDQIEAAYGPDAAALSDRTPDADKALGINGVNAMGDGRFNFLQRGDPSQNDAYMFAIISVHYRLRKLGTFIPKF